MNNKHASILMITLWILTILVIFTIGLGYRTSIDLRLSRYQKDSLRATYLAKAGINKAISILKEDATDSVTQYYDTTMACGVNPKDKELKDIFSQQWNSENEGFKIGYKSFTGEFVYGLRDEDSRININGLGAILTNKVLLEKLFEDVEDYPTLVGTIITSLASDATQEANILKKQKFGHPEELLVMLEYAYEQKGREKKEAQKKAREVYDAVKDLITVYGSNKININTASKDILTMLATALVGDDPAIANLITGIEDFRNGKDGPFVIQNSKNNFNLMNMNLSIPEQKVFAAMERYLTTKSDFFRITVTGYVANITKEITVIYDRKENKIVSWHQN